MEEISDVEMTPAPPTVDTKEVVTKWNEKFAKGVLSGSHLKDHWCTWVPRMYSPSINESCLNWNFNEDEAYNILFNTVEVFIFNGDPNEVLAQLSKYDKPPTVCGRVFKMGEPTYSCRECGMDNTCVLCVNCFKKSEHRFHKYKMGNSGGGGCCDCGDKEAWKKAPFCDIHIVGTQEETEVSGNLPEDIADRARIVFDAILWYAYNLLCLEHTADLRLGSNDDNSFDIDTYCTVLYNDEIHTFEQVINTLNRVIKCSQKNAIEYVTNIDREGRAVVKCSTFQHCNELKIEIEKHTSRHGNKALKVLVVPAHVVAHQLFSMKLLSWLQQFLGHSEGFRKIFAEVALKSQQSTGTDQSVIKGILQHDSHLWKSARTHWHRLFISGMLREYENKKALAKVFTKNYGSVMKDFIKDDHDHSFSVSSLAVQLFTVPTLAHHLIEEEDVLFLLLNTFLSECSRKCNKLGKLEFERNVSSQAFKRAQYILYDLRYLLSAIPEKWTDALRRNFLQGLSVMLQLLTIMQGMDSVVRQVGQHMEYEPEWESAFNLHIKLAYCISLAIKWCSTDKVVLVKAYRLCLKKLYENPCYDPNEAGKVRELVDHSVTCLSYDVSTKAVSIHLSLSRFLAGLHLHLENYGLNFDSAEFQIPKPTPVQIIEPVLRTQVMIAQVHAGMWRRNGYALLNQLYFYHNVKCRTEMLDRDIQLLQIGASLIESNEFLIHLLNKFNLINWANPNFEIRSLKSPEEDSIRQIINIVEEFLQLVISIVGERHIPGISDLTTQDRVKKEIIQHLCIKPLPHSELNKTIPDDLTHETGLDDVIEELAVFKKPTQGSGRGVYELKNQYFDEYNVFFYHYTREDLSKSEETQRKRRKTDGELDCCPPSNLPKLKESFNMIVNLLQCDVMLHIMQTVLERCLNLKARSFSEPQLHKVLHLIGYALQEEQSRNYPFLLFAEKAAKWDLPKFLEALISSPRIDAHKDLLRWTLQKYKQVAAMSAQGDAPSTSTMETSADSSVIPDEDEKQRKAKLAAQRRAKIMAQMAAMQNQFMKENAKLFEETQSEIPNNEINEFAMETTEVVPDNPVCLGPKQTARTNIEKTYTCILCQETQKSTVEGPALVLAGFVQQATVLCTNRTDGEVQQFSDDPLFLNSNCGPAPYTSTCGHVMHAECWQKYFDNVMVKEHRRPYRLRHPASFDIDKREFLCPLCECLSNTVLPLIPGLSSIQQSHAKNEITYADWLTCIVATVNSKVKACHGADMCTNLYCSTCESVAKGILNSENSPQNNCEADCKDPKQCIYFSAPIKDIQMGTNGKDFVALFPQEHPTISPHLVEMIHLFIQAPYTRGLAVEPHPSERRLPSMTWKSLAYTLHTIEVLLRDSNKPLLGHLSSRHRDCLESLIRITGILGSTWQHVTVISSHALRLLSMLVDHQHDDYSILQWDSLGLLVALTFSLPSLFGTSQPTPVPTGGSLDLHTLQLVFTAHIVKILIVTDKFQEIAKMDTDSQEIHLEDGLEIRNILIMLGKYHENAEAVWDYVKNASLPFLRCCVLFYHILTDVQPLFELTEIGGDTFENMCAYLGLLTTPEQLFGSKVIAPLVYKWCNHDEVRSYLSGNPLPFSSIEEPQTINQLIDLPNDYSELINTVSSFTCPNSNHEDSRNPTMCLICGEILCSQSYCCQTELNKTIVGACNYHAYKCGAGIGVFLRVRECEILFLASPMRGCFVSPPYLDEYGETDQGLRRGNPLQLCKERYKKLHTLWLSHSIHEEIARAIESSTNVVATQWQHL
ncbi:hypothetical protein PPYR_06767 [Photinus pyralis]|uniref:E3 ubiquitin-protein ligase n=1 Tax=Photinus pyralis TaxID=7054 RepID=A0A1Y1LPA2_PHOPY|nr:E3 ubiquitin-protein ligase UBR2 [Photinus pyralis]XP_031338982.1 E3 ubiquitin-protein ligase UBR2 [Photinus pyralis]XP_031338983.1 E3 ubiquitin-protein ligase UBR2 [Photinus pyralis]KAB0798887.1 hypothetical protein PPYR_06767 [Photinus pyralis]